MIATASELFEARHYPSVIAVCTDALDDEPECLPLLLIRARAHVALRRDLDAQADLRDVIRLDPSCSVAYRLLGELAARRDEDESAAAFFREALRLNPGDRSAHDWLLIVVASLASPASPAPGARVEPARIARGTQPPEVEDRPTQPFARCADRDAAWAPRVRPPTTPVSSVSSRPTLTGRPALQPPSKPAPRVPPIPPARGPTADSPATTVRSLISRGRAPASPAQPSPPPATTVRTPRTTSPELPGFGEYLVASGILSRERLRAAEAYQRSMKVQLSTAIVTLGLATPQRIAWAVVAHQSQLARDRQVP